MVPAAADTDRRRLRPRRDRAVPVGDPDVQAVAGVREVLRERQLGLERGLNLPGHRFFAET